VRTRDKTANWRCRHFYPIEVVPTEGGKRARCLGCGVSGPVQADTVDAMRALRGEAKYPGKAGA
jgi:hypothetical protein